MKIIKLLIGLLGIVFITMTVRADSVTLKSGVILQGSINSESETQVVIEVASSNRTIFASQVIPKSQIQSLHHDTAEERQALEAYDQLRQFKLNPDQECTTNRCFEAMTAFQRFLSLYPSSSFVPTVRQNLQNWENEYRSVTEGFVKYENAWIKPVEKEERLARAKFIDQQTKVKNLELQRRQLVENIARDAAALKLAEMKVATMPDTFTSIGFNNESRTVPNTEKAKAKQEVAFYQGQKPIGQQALAALDTKIEDAKKQLTAASQIYKTALAKTEAAASKNSIEIPPTFTQSDEISLANGFDAFLFACENGTNDFAVDPVVVDDLVAAGIELPSDGEALSIAALRPVLEKKGFIFREAEIDANRKIMVLTMPSAWVYHSAIQKIKTNQLRDAIRILSTANSNEQPFGGHCYELRKALEDILRRDVELAKLDEEIRKNVLQYRRAIEMMELCKMAVRSSNSEIAKRSDFAMAELSATSANTALSMSCGSMQILAEKVSSESPLSDRFRTALDNDLMTEAQFLFAQISREFTQLQVLSGLLQIKGLESCRYEFTAEPKFIRKMRSALDQRVLEASGGVEAATRFISTDLDTADKTFSRSYFIDPGSPAARVGTGYCDFKCCIVALRSVFEPLSNDPRSVRLETIVREARRDHQFGRLRAIQRVAHQHVDDVDEPIWPAGNGNGLAVSQRQGGLLGIYVHLVPRDTIVVTDTEVAAAGVSISDGIHRVNYWAAYGRKTQIAFKERLVAFGDYGDKDDYMEASAEEMCKWIVSAAPFDTNNKRLLIDFQSPYVNKAGDSAGVTFAVSGYSYLKALPLRTTVAMTGSIRASGSIKAIGGVPQKIDGASHSEGIEIIIVPKENEPDLSCVPVDQLCKLVIITGSDIKTYLKYALAPTPGITTNEQFAASQVIAAAQQAQAFLLAGNYEGARQLLTKITKTNPEIYSARRLLTILRRKIPVEQSLASADRIEIQKVSIQLDMLQSQKTNSPDSGGFTK